MYCKKCGSKLPENAQFCTNCGAKVDDSADNKSAQQTPKANEPMKNKLPKKMSKKAWIIVAIAAVVLICGGFLYNYLTNPKGVWLGDSNADVLDIEGGGTGYFNEYGFDDYNDAITWKRTGFNKIQIKYTDDGKQYVFDAKLENGKLVTPDGENWNAETFKKTNKSESEAKSDVQNYINPTMKSLIDSPRQHIWLRGGNHGNPTQAFKNNPGFDAIYVTQNGKSTCYPIDEKYRLRLSQASKMTDDELINYAKNHLDKQFKVDNETPENQHHLGGSDDKKGTYGTRRGSHFYTGYTSYDPDFSYTDISVVRLPVPNDNANPPCLQFVN